MEHVKTRGFGLQADFNLGEFLVKAQTSASGSSSRTRSVYALLQVASLAIFIMSWQLIPESWLKQNIGLATAGWMDVRTKSQAATPTWTSIALAKAKSLLLAAETLRGNDAVSIGAAQNRIALLEQARELLTYIKTDVLINLSESDSLLLRSQIDALMAKHSDLLSKEQAHAEPETNKAKVPIQDLQLAEFLLAAATHSVVTQAVTLGQETAMPVDERYLTQFDVQLQEYMRGKSDLPEEVFSARANALQNAYLSNVLLTTLPILNIKVHINDLGLIGGCLLLIVCAWYLYCLGREISNLDTLFHIAEEEGVLVEVYTLHSMEQILSVPPSLRESHSADYYRNFGESLSPNLPYLPLLMPLVAQSFILYTNSLTRDVLRVYDATYGTFIDVMSILSWIAILIVSVLMIRLQMGLASIWNDSYNLVKSDFTTKNRGRQAQQP